MKWIGKLTIVDALFLGSKLKKRRVTLFQKKNISISPHEEISINFEIITKKCCVLLIY